MSLVNAGNTDKTISANVASGGELKVDNGSYTNIQVAEGGTLNYKDEAAVRAEAEERRKDMRTAYETWTPMGQAEKAEREFFEGMDKLFGKDKPAEAPAVNSNRFNEAISMSAPGANDIKDTGLSK